MNLKINNILIIGLSLIILLSAVPSSGYGITQSYTNTNSQVVSFSKYEGKLLLVEGFWTGCIHCKNEYPTIKQIYDNYSSRVSLLSLAIWPERDNVDTISQWIIDYPSAWDVGVDTSGTFDNTYGITATPTLVLFSKQGTLLYKWTSGETSFDEISSVLDYYLSFTNVDSSSIPPYSANSGDNGSVIGNLFGSPIFMFGFFSVLIFAIYFKAAGGKPPA